jgi:hypothetical protein
MNTNLPITLETREVISFPLWPYEVGIFCLVICAGFVYLIYRKKRKPN